MLFLWMFVSGSPVCSDSNVKDSLGQKDVFSLGYLLCQVLVMPLLRAHLKRKSKEVIFTGNCHHASLKLWYLQNMIISSSTAHLKPLHFWTKVLSRYIMSWLHKSILAVILFNRNCFLILIEKKWKLLKTGNFTLKFITLLP